jgi:hypothetical protein
MIDGCECGACQGPYHAAEEDIVRWVCVCGNLVKVEPQLDGLEGGTLHCVAICCKDRVPRYLRSKLMEIAGVEDPKPGEVDSRRVLRCDKRLVALNREES